MIRSLGASAAAFVLGTLLALGAEGAPASPPASKPDSPLADVTQGALRFKSAEGKFVECPLKHTDVQAEIAGFVARVRVTQEFVNPSKEKIEAVYVFPLPHESAVDGMTMKVGERTIVGVIKKRGEARRIYRQALAEGLTAALLEQERPNIFVQSVGNIEPGGSVKIEITYADVLGYDLGAYTFHFPMVVGPRYSPRPASQTSPPGQTGPTGPTATPAAAPPYLKPTERSGHDISLSLTLDAGVPIHELKSTNHQVVMTQTGKHTATCRIAAGEAIPNKDFELKYKVVGAKPETAILAHADSGRDGYFLLMVQPKEDAALQTLAPRELVFLVDVSGSMSGEPTAKVRQAMACLLEQLHPRDRLQVVTFASSADKLFPAPVEASPENVEKALGFSRNLRAGGGTELLKGLELALGGPAGAERARIVVLLTDGFIDNEAEIAAEVAKRAGDKLRFWCLGIGSSVNRHLVEAVAKQGGGMGKVLSLKSTEAEVRELAAGMVERLHRPQIANLTVNWGDLKVSQTHPERIPELWSGRPVVLFGRYSGGGRSRIRICGEAEGRAVSFEVLVEFPEKQPANDALASIWARRKVESLTDRMAVVGETADLVGQVTDVALEHRLMTKYTSFVAVDEAKLRSPKPEGESAPKKVAVPVPVPEGVDRDAAVGPGGAVLAYEPTVKRDIFKKLEESDHFETDSAMDKLSARGDEDAISDTALGGTGTVGSIGVGGAGMAGTFGYRDGGGRKKAVGRWGGSVASESVVESSLRWLARHQEKDGSWDAKKLGAASDCRGEATGLAVLAFLGAGYTQTSGKFTDNLKRAAEWMAARQAAGRRGGFDVPDADYARAHAVLTLALSEAYGMSKDDGLREPAQKAVDFAVNSLQEKYSGWAAKADAAPDAVTTAWFVAALKSARIAGLKVEGAALGGAMAFLDKVGPAKDRPGSLLRAGDAAADPAATMAAVAARILLGTPGSDPALAEQLKWAVAEGRKRGLDAKRDPVWLYFGALGCFQSGGATWTDWNDAMKKLLLEKQEKGGLTDGSEKDLDGSWPAEGAGAQLCLEVYYRYLPMYSK
jgi:Ca-activated chloride channel family protein